MALKNTLFYFIFIHNIISGLWIRIRMDSHSFSLLDPDPGGKNLRKKRTNERKLVVIVGKFRSAPYQLFFFLVFKNWTDLAKLFGLDPQPCRMLYRCLGLAPGRSLLSPATSSLEPETITPTAAVVPQVAAAYPLAVVAAPTQPQDFR